MEPPQEPSPSLQTATALVLIAHGSRQDEANTDLYHVVTALRRRGRYDLVEPSFLELAEPTIEQATVRCVERGMRRVLLLPYFLSAGVHVRRDLREIRDRLAGRFLEVEFRLGEPLGGHPLLLEVVAERAREAESG